MNKEFQVILMAAGRGSRFIELCTHKPKALLPIGNQPMIMFPLLQIHRAGFKEAILVCPASQKSEFQNYIDNVDIPVKVDLIEIPANDNWGTADTIRYIRNKIKSDILVISCDVISDMNLNECLNLFRLRDASVVACFSKDMYHDMSKVVILPGPKNEGQHENDYIHVEHETQRLVTMENSSDGKKFMIDKFLLMKHSGTRYHMELADLHIYVLKQWICDYIANDKCVSIKLELIPHIVAQQGTTANVFIPKKVLNKDDSPPTPKPKITLIDFAEDPTHRLETYRSRKPSVKDKNYKDLVRIYSYIHNAQENKFNFRMNTLMGYCYANKMASQLLQHMNKPLIHPKCRLESKQFCKETRIAEGATVEEKTSLTRTYIGPGSQVGSKTQLVDCNVMNEVVIEEGCKLVNCILCDNCRICANTTLTNCLVGPTHIIASHSNFQNEVLTITMQLD